MPTAHQTGPLAAQNSVSRRNSNFCQTQETQHARTQQEQASEQPDRVSNLAHPRRTKKEIKISFILEKS